MTPPRTPNASPPETLDKYELAILEILQQDARAGVQEIADQIGLSVSPTWRRIRALEERGYIENYIAVLDVEKLGFKQCVFAHVTLAKHDRAAVRQFEQTIERRSEVLECFSMTGDADYLLRVIVRETPDYEQFLQEAVYSCPAVQSVRSNFALRKMKFTLRVPFE
ncbi:Lrp/AsnC family transcriptional regulator [Verticiella sediminum]|uniref:Lrp/AsnC family transcriptional regulator n=1 Tax=Verticiella sediminum TaxID=1247510 RepID=A0A556AIY6_9BURK|nr:Lrp/AsnC family transcriptional regulator [Verticiella sediminum]TSH92836.1 Lrp/AsnC family transcriptional regulator [Verticiella sediminum]